MKRLIGLGLTVVGAAVVFEYLRRRGVVDQVKGGTKRFVGKVTDNKQLEAEGVLDSLRGKTLEVVDDVKHGARATIDDINDVFEANKHN